MHDLIRKVCNFSGSCIRPGRANNPDASGRKRERQQDHESPASTQARRTRRARSRSRLPGAGGGVGTGCIILAKHLGAEVIACTSSAPKMQKLKQLGADEVINVNEVDFSKWAVEKYGKPQRRNYEGGVDVV